MSIKKPGMGAIWNGPGRDHEGVGARLIHIEKIHPLEGQPRRYFDLDALADLAQNIKDHGLLQPILVFAQPDGSFSLIAGERRLKAMQMLGHTQIQAIVKAGDVDPYDLALFENTQRENLNPFEKTQAILSLIARRMGWDEADVPARVRSAERFPDTQPEVTEQLQTIFSEIGSVTLTNFVKQGLRILTLAPVLAEALKQGKISYTKALAIQGAPEEHHTQLLEAAIRDGLSVSQINARKAGIQKRPQKVPTIQQRLAKSLNDKNFDKKINALSVDDREKVVSLLSQLEALLQ